MSMKKRLCKCPPKLQQTCKHAKVNTDCKDVVEIIEALTFQAENFKKNKKQKPPSFKTKPFKPRHYKDTCVPMAPSMHTRLRYIGHCSAEPPVRRYNAPKRKNYPGVDFESSSEDEGSGILRRKKRKESNKKRVTYFDLVPADISLPMPPPIVKHTASDKSIFNVPSPKVSGEVIRAQKAVVKSTDYKPPLPPKAGYELFKPHSGIVINRDKSFVPDTVFAPGPRKFPSDKPRKPCRKGGLCLRKDCPRKKCRKYAAQRRKQMHKKGSGIADIPYTTIGVTDGKPRARGTQKHLKDDDSVCGLDEIPKPEHVHIPANLKRGTLETHSLTVLPCTKERRPDVHYGILTGSFNMYDPKFGGRSRGRQALTMSVMAYCLAFHYHPKQWTMKLIDNLIDAGDQWYVQCLDKVHDHSAVQGICEVLPFGKKQTLVLNGKRMQVLLGEPEVVGYTMSLDPTVYNLCRGLKAFFKDNRAGVVLTRVMKVVIWRDKVCYYIFDPAGRDSRAYSNFSNGCSALINVKDLQSVADVILARSVIEDQKFVLAPVKVLKMIDEQCDEDFESDKELTQAEKAMMGYRILNENCAIVNANMHLGDRCFEDAKFRQAIPIAVVAMTYAKISPPNTWFSKTLDKVLRLGNKLYMDCLHPKVMIDMTIDNIPNEIIVGPYACEIIIYRERIKGQLFTTKECILNIKSGLDEFFSHEYNGGILDFNNYSLAIWRQKDMYYLFDPYPRTNDGLRSANVGKACCWMLLNPETMASIFTKNWDYLPATTQFYVHAFKVLKLKKREPKAQIFCTLSDEQLPGAKGKLRRKVLPISKAKGDGKEIFHNVMPREDFDGPFVGPQVDEEQMGDIISLVDSIQEDYLPPIPLRYKNAPPDPLEDKIVNLDSPTVSVTQIVPPWPKPRDKSNELPEPDPDPEPTPPPTPPPAPPPEGGVEEEEDLDEEEDEETMKKKREEEERRKAEEEEARRKAEELPPPLPPPPPSPQPEPEVPLAPAEVVEDEVQTLPAVNVDRHILLTEDAKYRSKLRKLRKKMTQPLTEDQLEINPDEELAKPSNFKNLPDNTQIIRGSSAINDTKTIDVLPFAAVMAIVTSYKYSVNTWTAGIVNFVVDTAKKLHENKQQKFQLAPVHIIPKIAIGHQAYNANIDVMSEGPTWQLEDTLNRKFFNRCDRGMVTTATYSCAFFKKNGLYYLYDGSSCNAMGLRDLSGKGKACFLRFRNLHDMVARISYNKDGNSPEQQFVISRIIVRRLMNEPRLQLPEDYNYETGMPKSNKSRFSIVETGKSSSEKKSSIESSEHKSETIIGYQLINSIYRIEGTTCLKDKKTSSDVKACHFVCLIAMLLATMHPIRTWDHMLVDTCIEKGLEIFEKATNKSVCEKRVIKNIILDGKFINVNIKKILVVNENPEKRLDQYLRAVLKRLRYVIVRFPSCSVVICQNEGYYHLFDPYPPPSEKTEPAEAEKKKAAESGTSPKSASSVATWTLYRSFDALIARLLKIVTDPNSPEFYTFELTSVKTAPRHSALNYRLSPLFKPDENPNTPYLRRRRVRPIVDEKMYWLNIDTIPWSRMTPVNDLGFERKTPKAMWKDWDIEFPGDLYSLWGSIHPKDNKFEEIHRGKQYLATCVVALVMTKACNLSAWTGSFLDGIVENGHNYHIKCHAKISGQQNHEVTLDYLDSKYDDMYPYSFSIKYDKVIFGFVYNIQPDRFNLSKALVYFFEKHSLGILISPAKNLAFGRTDTSYFLFDCQSHGAPIFCPGQGSSYILKCESLNRLIYCITITLNTRRHGQQFHLFSINVTLSEKSK